MRPCTLLVCASAARACEHTLRVSEPSGGKTDGGSTKVHTEIETVKVSK